MSEIGETLQAARMRAGLDIADVEGETKIRAKYLRALEQEDWGLLPGPTYVRSFLRTYADSLGLDGRMMVEQYRLQHERPSDQDLMPISPVGARRSGARPPRGPRPPRWAVVTALIALLAGALWLLGRGDESDKRPERGSSATTVPAEGTTTARTPARGAQRVSLRVRATGTLFVCVQDARGKLVVDGATLDAGDQTRRLSSTAFRLRLGNGNARLIVNGRSRSVADRSPQAYRVSASGVRPIPLDRSPSCPPG